MVVAELEETGDAAALDDEYILNPDTPPQICVESPSQGIEHLPSVSGIPYIVLPQ